MVERFAAPPINALISITPLSSPSPQRDTTAVPAQLANAQIGKIVEGFVVNRDAQNNPILRTTLGDVRIQSDVFIRTGSEVVFRVDTTQASFARILTIDGLPPQDYVATTARTVSGDTISATRIPANAATVPTAQAGAEQRQTTPTLSAILLTTAPLNATAIANNPALAATIATANPLPANVRKLPQGAQLTVRLLQVSLPDIAAPANAPSATPRPLPPSVFDPPLLRPTIPPATSNPQPAITATQSAVPASLARLVLNESAALTAPASPPATTNSAVAAVPNNPQAPAAATAAAITSGVTGAAASPTQATAVGNAVATFSSPTAAATTSTPNILPTVAVAAAASAPVNHANATGVPAAPSPAATTTPASSPALRIAPALPVATVATQVAQARAGIASSTLPLPATTDLGGPSTRSPSIDPRPRTATSATYAPASPPATGIAAYVIGHEKDGAIILQSSIGTLKLYSQQPLPVGTTVRLDISAAPPSIARDSTGQISEEVDGFVNLARSWPALEDALAAFPASDSVVNRAIAQAVPEIGARLTSGLLFFITAVRHGDVRQWLGRRALEALEEKSPALAARMKQDMLQLQTLLTDSPLQHWNSAMIPLLYQGQLEHARFFFRNDGERDGSEKNRQKIREQRFIVEVDLSALGALQFDGFVRPGERGKQFDLVIRSESKLSPALSQHIRDIFETSLASSGQTGYLAFQEGSQHFVRPMADSRELPPGSHGVQPILA